MIDPGGQILRFQQFGESYQLRIESGEELVATLKAFLVSNDITFGQMAGLGAVRSATVSYWNSASKQYETHERAEQMEVISLVGNVTLKDGEPFTHIHLGLGRSDLSMIGGHLNAAIAHPLLEIWLTPVDGTVKRVLDESCGLFLMELSDGA
jgi:predicted DNA-binding protein with PD1-like motif